MKGLFTIALAASFATAAVAAPTAEPEARSPFCHRPGQPCWKVRRAAEAAAEALADPEAVARNPFCYRPGAPCWKAKREAEAIIEAIANGNST
jgi:hypothetical protein